MSWRDGYDILIKGISILETHFTEKNAQSIYLAGLISALCEHDFDYMQFRESRTPYDDLLDYVDKRDEIFLNAFSKVESSLKPNIDTHVFSHFSVVARRNITHAESIKLKIDSDVKKEAFHSIWDMSSEYISDEESLHYYTECLVKEFLFSTDEIDELVEREKKLAPIVKLIKKEEEIAFERLQKSIKKTRNIHELEEIFKKVEASIKRSLTALSKNMSDHSASEQKAKMSVRRVSSTPEEEQSVEKEFEKYNDLGFAREIDRTNKQHFQLIAERTGHNISDVQNILQAYERCLLEDLEAKNRTKLLTILSLRASVTEEKPNRTGLNPFTGEEMLFKARPARLKVKATETIRLKGLLTTMFGNFTEQSNISSEKPGVSTGTAKKKSKVRGKKKSE